jgi:hypothetical protein
MMNKSIRNAIAFAILLALTVAIAGADYALGRDFSLWVVYVIPIALASSIAGMSGGALFSLLAGALLLYVGEVGGNPFPSALCFYFEVGSDVAAYLFISCLVSVVRKYLADGNRASAPDLHGRASA